MSLQTPRVGIFGGAFDPPHNAHLVLARCALAQLQLDVLHVLPTGQAWHRQASPAAAQHRLAMAQLAFGGLERVRVDDRELLRSGPTYTVDTLHALQPEYPGARFFLVLGADQAQAFTRWQRWEEIVADATICIAARDASTGISGIPETPGGRPAPVLPLNTPALDVSATDIRQRVGARLGVAHLVPEAVARYIDHHQLYQAP